ncbi:MAG: amidohydrolase [Bacteroidia bacterium]
MKPHTFLYTLCLATALACNPPGETVDLAIVHAHILTIDDRWTESPDGTVLVRGGAIVGLGASDSLAGTFRARQTIDARGQLLLPGLVNTHSHAAMVLLRGLADDLALQAWLEQHIWPAEGRYMDARAVRLGTRLAWAEMIRGGITTVNDTYFFVEEVARTASEAGLRAIVAEGLLDFPTPSSPHPDSGLACTRRMAATWAGHPRIGVAVSPHSPYTCAPSLLRAAGDLARELDLPLHIHLAETATEDTIIYQRYRCSPTRLLDSLGVLGPRTIAAHGVMLDAASIATLAQRGSGVSHNPESNMKLASGVAPIPALLAAGVTIGLGTDGAASNNNLDMFQEMSAAARLQKVHHHDPHLLDARQVLYMATRGGAALLGMDDRIGSVETGKQADFVLIDLGQPHLQPVHNLYALAVYSMRASDVRTVVVGGTLLMHDGRLLTLDEQRVVAAAAAWADSVRQTARR